MNDLNQPQHLLRHQYANAANLQARITLHERFGRSTIPWQRWIFDHLHLPAEAMVLEIGCGPGMLWRENVDRLDKSWHVVLSDFSAGMVREAKAKLAEATTIFHFVQSDAQQLPLTSETVDAVIANHMLYHVPKRSQAIAEFHRVLKPGGRLLAATNGEHHMQGLADLWRRFWPDFDMSPLRFNRHGFTLENGEAQLKACFPSVQMIPYADDLWITESAPLVAYMRSMLSGLPIPDTVYEAFERFVDQEIQQAGGILIEKATGLFVAS